MNLLFVAHVIVQKEGGEMSIDALVKRLNSSRQFKKPDNTLLTAIEVTDLINRYGKNIQLDYAGTVRTLKVHQKSIDALYLDIIQILKYSPEQAEIIGITMLFYARVAAVPREYFVSGPTLKSISRILNYDDPKRVFIEELQKLDQHDEFKGKLKWVTHLVSNVSDSTFKYVLHKIETFDLSNDSITVEDFAGQFEDLFVSIDHFSKEITYMPEFVREIISELAISKSFRTLYNPSNGVGEIFTSIYKRVNNPGVVDFIGQSSFDIYGFVAVMNMILHQIPHFNISTSDPLVSREIKPSSMDCVICQPPFGFNRNRADIQEQEHYRFGRSNRKESLFVELVLDVLNEKGRGFIILPEGFLSSDSTAEKLIRQYLLEEDILDAVISLPAGVYDSFGIKTNILVIDKHKREDRKGKVLFVDTFSVWVTLFDKALISDIAHITAQQIISAKSQEMVSEFVSVDEILRNNNRLQVSQYVNSYKKKIRNLLAHDETVRKIADVIIDIKFKGIATESEYPYIKGGDLSKDPTNPYLKMPEGSIISRVNGKLIDRSSVLVAKIGGALNPTIFKFSDQRIVINQNVYALAVNESVIDIDYLALELSSELVKEQLRGMITGTAMQYYNYADILNIQIRVPVLSERKKRVLVYQEQILAAKRMETQLLAEKISSQEDETNVLSAMKHSFAQLPFKSDLSNMEFYFDKKANSGEAISWADSISPAITSRSVREVFDGLNKMVDATNELFQNMENLINCDPSKMNLENVKIHDFIRSTLESLSTTENIYTPVEGTNIPVRIDTYQFKELLRNFVVNAKRHGFENSEAPHVIHFQTRIGDGKWSLHILNNGAPLPEDFTIEDFTSFGKRRGITRGSGIGGYVIEKVVKNHLGKFSIHDKRELAEIELKKFQDTKKSLGESDVVPIVYTIEFVLEFPFNFEKNA